MDRDLQQAAKDQDHRPKKDGWAPGSYICICVGCGATFFGDKRAMKCAPCAYEAEDAKEEAWTSKPLV